MLEGIPGHETFAAQYFIIPLEQLEIVLDRMFAIPLDEFVVGDSGLALRAPDLHGPREYASVIVHPIVERPGDDFLGVISEVVEYRDVRITGCLGAFRTNFLIHPQVFDRQRVVGQMRRRAQQHAAIRVERDRAGNVRVLADEPHGSFHFGF